MDALTPDPDAVESPPRSSAHAVAPTPAGTVDPRGGRPLAASAGTSPRYFARVVHAVTRSVWAPVAAKASAIAAGMLGLAALGAWSTLAGAGVPVDPAALRASADSAGSWLAPDPAPAGSPHAAGRIAAGGPSGSAAPSAAAAAPSAAAAAPSAAAAAPSAAAAAPSAPGASASPAGVTGDGKVVLNLATPEELLKLPRVGPKRAQAIVDLRQRLGKFRKATDLLRVRGIGRKTLVLMLPKLVVDPP